MELLEDLPKQYAIAHVLSEVNTQIDLKGDERDAANDRLCKVIANTAEIPVSSIDACEFPLYRWLGLTDAAIGFAAKERGCSILTNDSELYSSLLSMGVFALKFDDVKRLLATGQNL